MRKGFWVAQVAGLCLFLVTARLQEVYDSMQPSVPDTFVVWQEMRVPGASGASFARVGWAPDRIAELRDLLAIDTTLSRVKASRALMTGRHGLVSMTEVAMEPVGLGGLLGIPPPSCEMPEYYASAAAMARTGSSLEDALGQRFSVLLSERAQLARSLSGSDPANTLVRCERRLGERGGTDLLLLSGGTDLRSRLEHAARRPEFSGSADFSNALKFSRLDARLAAQATSVLGWVGPLHVAAVAVCLLVAFSHANLSSVRGLSTIRLKLMLGATLGRVFRLTAAREAVAAVSAGAIAVALFWAYEHLSRADRRADWWDSLSSLAGISLACWVVLVGVQAAWHRLGRVAPTTMASERVSPPLWPYAMAWASGVALSITLLTLALAVDSNRRALEQVDTGFSSLGRYAASLHLAPEGMERGGVIGVVESVAAMLPGADVAVACPAPWRFSGFSFLSNDDGSTGLGMHVTPRFFDVLGLAAVRGDLRLASQRFEGRSAVVQTRRSEERELWGRQFDVLGEIEGLRFGAYAPSSRSAILTGLAGTDCLPMDLVILAPHLDAEQVNHGVQRAALRFRGSWFGPVMPLDAVYREARGHIYTLGAMLKLSLALALTMSVVLTAALAAAVVGVQRKELAIRAALGATLAQNLSHLGRRIAKWLVAATVLGLFVAGAAQKVIESAQPSWRSPELYDSILVAGGFAALAQLMTLAAFAGRIRRQSLATDLSHEA